MFECQNCGHSANADVNAAENIRRQGVTLLARAANSSHWPLGLLPESLGGEKRIGETDGRIRRLASAAPKNAETPALGLKQRKKEFAIFWNGRTYRNACLTSEIESMTQQNIARQLADALRADPAAAAELALHLESEQTCKLREEFGEFTKRVDLLLQELTTANTNAVIRMDRMERDASTLKNMSTRLHAEKFAPLLADQMGMKHTRLVSREEVMEMGRSQLAGSMLESFVQADMVVLAQDGDQPAYIAAEVSYTGNRRDTQRALANAHVIAQATGFPARAALFSVRNYDEASEDIRSGQVFWFQLEDRDPDWVDSQWAR